MKITVYDFDKTIYDGDSSIDFYKYCLKRKPSILKYVPIQVYGALMYILGLWPKVKMKEKYFMFFKDIDSIDDWVSDFWKEHRHKLKGWYKKKDHKHDIIISASPEFLLRPICKEIGVKALIASKVDQLTGRFDGENCYGEEKVSRLNKFVDSYEMEEFYSDSLSDTPLALLAGSSYIVKRDELVDWKSYAPSKKEQMIGHFKTREFLMFLIIGGINTLNGIVFAYIFSMMLNDNVAYMVGYFCGFVISYLLNSYITFRTRLGLVRFIKYGISYIPNFIIQNIMVFLIMNVLQQPKLLAYALAAVVGIPVTFLIMKLFAFKRD